MRYNDPTGHMCSDPEDSDLSCENGDTHPFQEIGKRYNYYAGNVWATLPSAKNVPTGANFPTKPDNVNWGDWQMTVKNNTNGYYEKYRRDLFLSGYSSNIDSNGMIDDQVLISLVISGEFGVLKQTDPNSYQDHLGAVSKQYDGNSYVTYGPPICKGGCPSLKAQLVWLQAFHAMRNRPAFQVAFGPNSPTDSTPRWTAFLSDAASIMKGPFGSYSSFGENEDGVTILR